MKVEITNLLTVKNFAAEYGNKLKSRPYSASYVYKMIKENKITSEMYVDIDGIRFIKKSALSKI